MSRESLSLLEIRNLMLETLAYKNNDIDSEGKTFEKYGYRGTQNDLFRLMESLAIKKSLINEKVKTIDSAWGGSGSMLHPNLTTNFDYREINKIYESFHLLLNQGVISPGAIRNMGPNLPNFHVTEYGMKCLEARDILPYDVDDYMKLINEIDILNEWVKYYINQALMCYNSNCFEASLIMVGLSNEVIVESLIDSYINYLGVQFPEEKQNFKTKINKKYSISQKYLSYRKHLKTHSMKKDSELKSLRGIMDELASDTYFSFLRLTRNELAHPTELRIDRLSALMVFMSLTKYCQRQSKFIDYFLSKV